MKKAIVLFLVLALSIPMLCFIATAEEYVDSSGNIIPEEVVELANLQKGDTLHEYFVVYAYRLEACTSLEEILASTSRIKDCRYFVWQNENRTRYKLYQSFSDGRPAVKFFAANKPWPHYSVCNVINAIDSDIVIEKAYYFIEPIITTDSFYYFQTNLGDYVYFDADSSAIHAQVTTAEDFFDYLYVRQFKRETGLDPYEGGDAGDVVWVYVGIGALLLVVIGQFCLIRAKKKKEEEETYIPEDE